MKSAGKILSVAQIREADHYTILHEPVSSVDLMERAGKRCAEWLLAREHKPQAYWIFCGTGNNGGDGLVIARLLAQAGCIVKVFIVPTGGVSEAHAVNRKRIAEIPATPISVINDALPVFPEDVCVIDAILGTGVNRPLEGLVATCVCQINASGAEVIALDMPTGLYADAAVPENSIVINATHTISFECPRLCFFLPENDAYLGTWHILPIGLHQGYMRNVITDHFFLTEEYIRSLLHARKKFSHKGNYGHALLIAGAKDKMGAAVLATGAALRSGAGLVTAHIPAAGATVLSASQPEAMLSLDPHSDYLTSPVETESYSAAGIGPGIGTGPETQAAVLKWISNAHTPLVLDADALNIISLNKTILSQLPAESILTPHPKEWTRIHGESDNSYDRIKAIRNFAITHQVIVVLKGAHTCIAAPSGQLFFNSTGNPGMAKGGSGDVLTGLITGLLAQKYAPLEAACLGVYVHGLAGDLAAASIGETGMTAGDLIRFLPRAFQQVYSRK